MYTGLETGKLEINAEAVGFRVPEEFSHPGTDMAQTYVEGNYSGANTIEPITEVVLLVNPSYHLRTFGAFGVQNDQLARNEEGWPLTCAGNEQLVFGL